MSLKKVLTIASIFIVGLGIVGAWFLFSSNTNFKSGNKEIIVKNRMSLNEITNLLLTDTIILSQSSFDMTCKLLRYKDQTIKPGRYVIKSGMSNFDIVKKLRNGLQDPVNLTINNVRDMSQLCSKISQQLMLDSTILYNKLMDSLFLDSINLNRENIISLFIPNTYQVYYTITPEKLISKISSEHEKFWSSKNRREALQQRNITEAQCYTIASIVEKETTFESEKQEIAGVYLNRLKTGMKLQADPTVVFALGLFGIQRILFEHLSTASPYNTYMIDGLPPGPICMPSLSSLEAVIQSEMHEYLFFCAKPGYDGSHLFAKNYQAHLQNAAEYRKWLDKENIK